MGYDERGQPFHLARTRYSDTPGGKDAYGLLPAMTRDFLVQRIKDNTSDKTLAIVGVRPKPRDRAAKAAGELASQPAAVHGTTWQYRGVIPARKA
jgi:hypothetical protein